MSYLRVCGFHTATTGTPDGIGDFLKQVDAAGVPFLAYCADGTTSLVDAQNIMRRSIVPHNAIFRRTRFEHNQGGSDVPDYNKPPKLAAEQQWNSHVERWPSELDHTLIWSEIYNELRKEVSEADWIGELLYETSLLAIRDGYRFCGPGYASGCPDEGAWDTPGMKKFLRLVAANPTRLAVALHEYSFTTDDIMAGDGFLVGRFRLLMDACDRNGIARPPVFITEWGWAERDVPEPDKAMADIELVGEMYAKYPVMGAAIWALDGGWGDLDQQTHRLMEPLRDLLVHKRYDDPEQPVDPPVECRGKPRIQYAREMFAVPGGTTKARWLEICGEAYDARNGVVFSYDDAFMGDLDRRKVVLYDLKDEDKQTFLDWGDKHYPGVVVEFAGEAWPFGDLEFGYLFKVSYTLTGKFGEPRSYGSHEGADYNVRPASVNSQEPVLCVYPGVVEQVVTMSPSYGDYVIVKHQINGVNFCTWYCHLDNVYVYVGQELSTADRIGEIGSTGTEAEHLHLGLEIEWRGEYQTVDPDQFFPMHPHEEGVLIVPPGDPLFPIPEEREDMPLVVDISKWQGTQSPGGDGFVADTIDFRKMVVEGGVAGFIVRASGGIDPDPLYLDWLVQLSYQTARPFGNFHWLNPDLDGASQAEIFVTTRHTGVLGDWLDVEYNEFTGAPTAQQVVDFVDRYREKTGLEIGIYTNATWQEFIKLFGEEWGQMSGWFANHEKSYGSKERPWIPSPWKASDWGVTNDYVKYWQFGAYKLPGYARVIDHNAFHGSRAEFDYRFGDPPLPEIPGSEPTDVLIGLHAGADGGDISAEDLKEFRDLQPGVIKTLSSHGEGTIVPLKAEFPDAVYIVRAFLSFGGREVTPRQFYNWTLPDVERAVNSLIDQEVWVELHNEPNLKDEGLGMSWSDGAGFNSWLEAVLALYRDALPNVEYLFPGLSPGGGYGDLKHDSVQFMKDCLSVIQQCDGFALHGYWAPQEGWPMSKTMMQISAAVKLVPHLPVWITEASNNRPGVTPQQKAEEYAKFYELLSAVPNVKGVTYFIASALNPTWGWEAGQAETWTPVEMAKKVRSLL